MTIRPLLTAESYGLPGDVVSAFPASDPRRALYGLAITPDLHIDAEALSNAAKGGRDLAGGRPVWWASDAVEIVNGPQFGGRPVLDYTSRAGDVRFLGPTTPSRTILMVLAHDASVFATGNPILSLLNIVRERTDNGLELNIASFPAPTLTSGCLNFSPKAVDSNSVNLAASFLPPPNAACIVAFTFDGENDVSKAYVDSTTERASGTTATPALTSAEEIYALGSNLLNNGTEDERGWRGQIAAVIGYPGVLSSLDLGAAINALKARYFLDVGQAWSFLGSTASWTASNGSFTSDSDGSVLTPSASDCNLVSPESLTIDGGRYSRVVVDLTRTAARTSGAWEGLLLYATSGHGFSGSFRKAAGPDPVLNERTTLVWDMSEVEGGGDADDWTENTITRLRFDLDSGDSGAFKIHSIRVVGNDPA